MLFQFRTAKMSAAGSALSREKMSPEFRGLSLQTRPQSAKPVVPVTSVYGEPPMSFPNAPRRGKDRSRPEHFAFLRGYKGEELYGYLAGPMLWLEMHTSDQGSKPCLHLMTGGDLSCPKCKFGEPTRKGALGFYHWKDWKPYFLWVDESREDIYAGFRWLSKIKFGREKVKGSPVWAALCLAQHDEFPTTDPRRRKPADLTESLLRIFDDAALTMWYRTTHGGSDNGLSQRQPPAPEQAGAKRKPAKVDPMYAAAHRKVDAALNGTGSTDDALDQALRRAGAAPPSENGKHPPPGG